MRRRFLTAVGLLLLGGGALLGFLWAAQCVTVTQQDSGKALRLAAGTTLVVKLQAVPGTGYIWYVREIGTGLRQLGPTRFEPQAPGSGAPGATEIQVFKFLAQKSGDYQLRLVYARSKDIRKEVVFTAHVQ